MKEELDFCGSAKMQPIRDLVAKVAATNTTLLLRGESGVGKEVVARAIHKASPRAHRQFLKVNCAALPGELRSEEHTSELQSRPHLVCRLLLEKKKQKNY